MTSNHSGMHQLLLAREQGVAGPQESLRFQRDLHFPIHFASKLCVEHTYHGHNGCVNRLAWNADGSLLVSGSDDRRAIIWSYPDVDRPPLALSTEHRANIFGCQFLPCTGDRRIVTGAMDDTVQLHDLEASPGVLSAAAAAAARGSTGSGGGGRGAGGGGHVMHRRATAAANLQVVVPRTQVFLSHKDRVKDVKVEPLNPHNFWSGGEDGIVRQYDTRAPNQDKWESPTVLVQVRDGHKTVQVKSIDINKAHPHLMAVAGSDPYVRLYDRRKLSAGCWKRRGATHALMALAPPHLPLAVQARHGRAHATYVSFSNRGDKLVATYHGDHAYSFDITSAGDVAAVFPQPSAAARPLPGRRGVGAGGHASAAGAPEAAAGPSGSGRGGTSRPGPVPLPARAEEAKARGNAAMFERKWPAAVSAFSDGLYFAPAAPVLYALRAEALLRRGWVGDAAMALRDCDTAVALDASYSRAFLSRIQALQQLQQYQCALTAVDEYRRRFPGRAADDVASLASQLRASVEERRRTYEARRQQHERRRVQRAEALASSRAVANSGGSASNTSPALRNPGMSALRNPGMSAPAPAEAMGVVPPVCTTLSARAAGAATTTTTTAAINALADADAVGTSGVSSYGPEASYHNGRTVFGDNDPSAVSTDVMQGPPLPPSWLDSTGREEGARGESTAAAAEAEPGSSAEDDRDAPAAMPDLVGDTRTPADASAGAAAAQEQEQDGGAGPGPDPGLGPETPREVEVGLEGVWEEAEEEAAAEDAAEAREVEEEEEEMGRARTDSDDDSSPGDGDGGGEEDPDLELFLQYYARAIELAGSCADGTGVNTPTSSDRPAGPRANGFAPRRVPGAWGGSPGGRRMIQRYVGQCNVQTDIKEATFVGSNDQVVAAGSDCGRVFLYDADSGAVLRVLAADEDVANCVQCHPTLPLLATSGIENVVRLWGPKDSMPEPGKVSDLQDELASVVERNQERMKEGPTVFRPSALQEALQENPQLWHLLMSQLYGRGIVAGRGARAGAGDEGAGAEEEGEEDEDDAQPEMSCRMA